MNILFFILFFIYILWGRSLAFDKLYLRKTRTQVFSFEFYETFNDTFFIKHLWWLFWRLKASFQIRCTKAATWSYFGKNVFWRVLFLGIRGVLDITTSAEDKTSCRCVKSFQIRSFFWSVFSYIRAESPYLVQIQEKTDLKKVRI